MYDSFQVNVGMTPAEASEAVSFYRTLGKADGYTTGAKLFDGVGELIRDVAAAGVPQATASSKPEVQVDALMDHFDLSPLPHRDRRRDARTSARSARRPTSSPRRCADCEMPASTRAARCSSATATTMSRAAAEHGVPVIFVRWGFSWPHESAGAQAAVDTVDELRSLLLLEATADD